MAYDEKVVDRLRAAFARALGPADDVEEKKMFGGISQMVNGHMCVGVLGSDLVLRVRAEEADTVLTRPHARPFDFTGRPMKGWVYVGPAGFATDADLDGWVRTGLAYVHEAGPKGAGAGKSAKRSPAPKAKAKPASSAPPKKTKSAAPAKAKRGSRAS